MTPVFLLSLPRSGSTLLQRKLMEHRDIASADEPWILLPLLLARHRDAGAGIHQQGVMVRALEDFERQLPARRDDWDAAVRAFAETLYARSAPDGARYFLDKTPRYALFAPDLVRTFPQARFILLWRDPLAIVQSMNESFFGGAWGLHHHEVDLYRGLEGLVAAQRQLGSRAHVLRYEDLVQDPEGSLAALFGWLGLDPAGVDAAPVTLRGRMGDPRRHGDDGRVRVRSRDWRETPLTAPRRRWLRRYLDWIGAERLALMGHDLGSMQADLARVPSTRRGLARDAFRILLAPAFAFFDYPLRKRKARQARTGERLFVHD